LKGIVFDIKRFAVHDGPGIRSSVFTKGCSLRCEWCQNPEGLENKIDLWYFETRCIQCHKCIETCPEKALSIGKEKQPHIIIDKSKCNNCSVCTDHCPTKALAFDSREMSVDEVMDELQKDKVFYKSSGGGITLTGGDPVFQHQFNLEILKQCKKEKLHTAIESSMFSGKVIFKKFIPLVDLFIVDIKTFDSTLHKNFTGFENSKIKANFEMIAAAKVDILVRIPMIPGFTDNEDNIKDIAKYVYQVRADIKIELLNFNPLARDKYRLMNRDYKMNNACATFSDGAMDRFNSIINSVIK
jgi:pyruvate formate lyase activating enzyme